MFTAAALKSEQWKHRFLLTLKLKQATLKPHAQMKTPSYYFLSIYHACGTDRASLQVISSPLLCACVGRGTTALLQWWEAARLPAEHSTGYIALKSTCCLWREPGFPAHDAEQDIVSHSNPSPAWVTRRRLNLQCDPASGCWGLWRDCDGDHIWARRLKVASLLLKRRSTTPVIDVRPSWLQEKRIRARLNLIQSSDRENYIEIYNFKP